MTRRGVLLCLAIVLAGSGLSPASTREKSPIRRPLSPSPGSNQPFLAFHRIDALLTKLDRDNQLLRTQFDEVSKLQKPRERANALRRLRRSVALRAAVQTSTTLVTISQREEALYAKHKQSYGRVLFRELHMRARVMQATLIRERRESAIGEFAHQQHQFSQRLLAFVLQFQAISGGYGALACDAGGWTCCQPRIVMADGKTAMKGCTWLCATKTAACREGCLGPRIPNVTISLQPIKPRVPSTPARPGSRPGISQ